MDPTNPNKRKRSRDETEPSCDEKAHGETSKRKIDKVETKNKQVAVRINRLSGHNPQHENPHVLVYDSVDVACEAVLQFIQKFPDQTVEFAQNQGAHAFPDLDYVDGKDITTQTLRKFLCRENNEFGFSCDLQSDEMPYSVEMMFVEPPCSDLYSKYFY
jgi:hypothetical protein